MAKSKFWEDYTAGTVKKKTDTKEEDTPKRSSFWDDYEAGTVKKKADTVEKESPEKSSFWDDYAAGTVKRKTDASEPKTEKKLAPKGEAQRGSTKDSDRWPEPGKAVRPENQRVTASVRTSAEVQSDIDALNKEYQKQKGAARHAVSYADAKTEKQKLAALETSLKRLEQERSAAKTAEYDSLLNVEDYEQNSGYHSTRTETASGNHRPVVTQSGIMNGVIGYGDWVYEYINKNPDILNAVKEYRKGEGKAASAQGYDLSFLEQMDEDEVRTYNYLYAAQGKEAAQGFLDYIRTDPYYEKGSLNKRQRKATETAYREFAEENPVAASAVSVLQTPATVTSYAGQVVNTLLNGETDPNASYNKAVYTKSAARDAVAGKIEESLGETWGPIGSFGYQVGMSMGDFLLANALTGGAGTSFVLGSNAAADVTLNALDKGVDSKDALALGAVAGLAEYATEKLSVDQLFNSSWEENALKYLFKNALTEAGEEAVSSVINTISDILLSGDKSEWKQAYSAYRKQGFDEREAFSKTFVDHLKQIGLDALGGAISGSLMAGGNIVIGSAAKSAERKTNQAHGATHQSIYDTDTENTKAGNATDHLGAVNDALNAAQTANPADSVQKAAEYVRTIRDAKPNTENAVNTAVDFVREKIRMYNDLIKTTKDETLKAQYQNERTAAINVDKTLRSNRKEIDRILAESSVQSVPSESVRETATEAEAENVQTVEDSENFAPSGAPEVSETSEVPQEFRRLFEEKAGSVYGSSPSTTAHDLISKNGTAARAAEILTGIDEMVDKTNTNSKERTEIHRYLNDVREAVLQISTPNAEYLAGTANAALKKYGVKVVVDTDAESLKRYSSGDRYGWYDGEKRTIHVSPYASDEKTFGRTVVHEFTHHAEVADNTLVDAVLKARDHLVEQKIIKAERYDFEKYYGIYKSDAAAYLETKSGNADISEYMKKGSDAASARAAVRNDYINGEIAADFMGDLMENDSFMRRFAEDGRTFLQKIHDIFREIAARLTGNTEVWMFERAADKLRLMLETMTGEQVERRTKNASRRHVESSDASRMSRRVLPEEERADIRKQERQEWLERQLVQLAADGSAARAVSPAEKDRIVASLASEMEGLTHADVRDAVKKVFHVIEHPKASTKAEITQEIETSAREAAAELYGKFKTANVNPLYDQYADLYRQIRTTRLNISDSIREEIPEWGKYYKSIFGKIKLVSNGGMSVDSFYNEISANYSEIFDRELTSESEMLQRIVEISEELKPVEGHPLYDASPEEDTAYINTIAGAILAHYQEHAHETIAAQNRKLRRENERLAQEANEARGYAADAKATVQWYQAQAESMNLEFVKTMSSLQKEIDSAERKLKRIQQNVVMKDKAAQLEAERKRAENILRKLHTDYQNPSKYHRIPAELRGVLADFLNEVRGADTAGTSLKRSGEQDSANFMKYTEYASRVVNAMDRLTNAGNTSGDYLAATQDFIKMFTDKIETLRKMQRASENNTIDQQLAYMKQLADICEMIGYHIRNADRIFMGQKKTNAQTFGEEWQAELKPFKRVLIPAKEYESESPGQFFSTLGTHGERLAAALNECQDLQMQRQEEYAAAVSKLLGDKYDTFAASIKGTPVTVEIDGKKVITSKGQLMSLYATWRTPAGRHDLMEGGAVFVTATGEKLSERTFKISTETYESLKKHLSADDIRIAEGMSRILTEICGAWGNDASMKLYGIMQYTDPLFFPVVSADDSLSSGWDSLSKENENLENSRADRKSAKPIKIVDIFDVADNHVARMASWSSYAPVTDSIRRILAVRGTKTALTDKFGEPALKYIDGLLQNIAENKITSDAETLSLLRWFESNYKKQAVSLNVSTAGKQFLSLIRAFSEIDAKYLMAANANPLGAEYKRAKAEMLKHSGAAKIKEQGFSDLTTGRSIRSQYDSNYVSLALDLTKFPKFKKFCHGIKLADKKTSEFGAILSEGADNMTWVRLWKACELEIDDKHPKVSAEERTRRITARFNEIIGKTQVIDSVLTSAPLTKDPKYRLIAPFTSENIKNTGWIYSAFRNWRNGKDSSGRHFAGVIVLSGLTYGVFSPIITSIFNAFRDEEDEETFEEAALKFLYYFMGYNPEADTENGEKTLDFWNSNAAQELISSTPSPLFSILYSVISDALSGFEASRMDSEAVSNFIKKMVNYHTTSEKLPHETSKTPFALGYEVATAGASLLGIPFNTVQRDLRSLFRTVVSAIPNSSMRKLRWNYNKIFYNLSNSSARSQKNFYDILMDAYNNRDTDAYRYMLGDLQKLQTGKNQRGLPWSKMKEAIENNGGKIEVGSDMWYLTLQSQFNLTSYNANMRVEKAITNVYQKALEKGLSNAENAIFKTPSNSTFSVYEETAGGEREKTEVEMSFTEYSKYVEDVGYYSYMIVSRLSEDNRWKNLSTEQQLYCLEKAYAYSKAYFKHEFDSRYESGTKWMTEMFADGVQPQKTADKIIQEAQQRK